MLQMQRKLYNVWQSAITQLAKEVLNIFSAEWNCGLN